MLIGDSVIKSFNYVYPVLWLTILVTDSVDRSNLDSWFLVVCISGFRSKVCLFRLQVESLIQQRQLNPFYRIGTGIHLRMRILFMIQCKANCPQLRRKCKYMNSNGFTLSYGASIEPSSHCFGRNRSLMGSESRFAALSLSCFVL